MVLRSPAPRRPPASRPSSSAATAELRDATSRARDEVAQDDRDLQLLAELDRIADGNEIRTADPRLAHRRHVAPVRRPRSGSTASTSWRCRPRGRRVAEGAPSPRAARDRHPQLAALLPSSDWRASPIFTLLQRWRLRRGCRVSGDYRARTRPAQSAREALRKTSRTPGSTRS